ncbi:iron chelate uptake ABC transporter family permease subunit [Streptomyces sp. 8P21H-1]|nr:iron chelate uptake ABC transporter family permease subunit [Streptomyces sp. 8P21H-1]
MTAPLSPPRSAEAPAGPSRERRSRPVLGAGLLAAALVLAAASVLSLAVGSGDVAPHDVVAGLFGPDRSVHGQMLVQEVRLPRTLAGLLAGAA